MKYPTLEECWSIVADNLASKGVSEQSIASFNHFIQQSFPQAIYNVFRLETSLGIDLSTKFTAKIVNVVKKKAILLNNDINCPVPENLQPTAENAKLLKSSLVCPVYVSLELSLDNVVEVVNNLLLCYMPLMVGSDLTKNLHKKLSIVDDGYFLISGNAKVIIAQETKIDRAVIVSNNRCMFKSKNVKQAWWLEKNDLNSVDIASKFGKCSLANIFAFYDFNLKKIWPLECRIETEETLLRNSPEECASNFQSVFPQSKTIDLSFLFEENDRKYLVQLSYMAHTLTKNPEPFDRDHLKNKRIEMASQLLMKIAQKSLRRVSQSFLKRMVNFIEKNPTKKMSRGVQRALDSRVVTEAFFYSLSTGNWPSSSSAGIETGVAQARSSYNFASILAQARKIKSGDDKRSIIGQRETRGDHKGFLSPFDTQEGRSCGTSKALCVLTTVSIEFDKNVILQCLKEIKNIEFAKEISPQKTNLIFVNGIIAKQTESVDHLKEVMKHLLQYRRCGIIDHHVSILRRKENLYVRTDGGRLLRPLFVVQNLHRHLNTSLRNISDQTFDQLVESGIIEYIDTDEENTLEVASSFQTITETSDLCEIHPSLILSLNTNYATLFPSHNQGPRITYQLAMSKQAMSQISADYYSNMQTRTHSLLYTQKPLTMSRVNQIEGFPKGSGLNCVVLIACYQGYNVEDSIVMSKSFIERGGFRMLDQKTFHYAGSETVSIDSSKAHWKKYNTEKFSALDDDGLPCPNNVLQEDSVIIAKHTEDDNEQKMDTSVLAKEKKGTISRVIFGHGLRRKKSSLQEESVKVNITTYETRGVIVGDKMASKHAQKGTVARIEPDENLPFTHDGITPDIILNPAALPTRMTIGMLVEMLGAKGACFTGNIVDATAFCNPSVEELSKILRQCGYNKHGDEKLIDGITGELIKGKMFMGVAYYQRLKHMVSSFSKNKFINNNLTPFLCRCLTRFTVDLRVGRDQ